MKGYDEIKQREKADKWQKYWQEQGYIVVNPFIIGDKLRNSFDIILNREPEYADYLKADLEYLESCTDIFFCYGWENSYGCMEEADKTIEKELKPHFESNIII
mgnify:CR=1 FL=1